MPSPHAGAGVSPFHSPYWSYSLFSAPETAHFMLPEPDLEGIDMAFPTAEDTLDAPPGLHCASEQETKQDSFEDDFKLVGLDAFEQTLTNFFTQKATVESAANSTDAGLSPRAAGWERTWSETSLEPSTPQSAHEGKASGDATLAEVPDVPPPAALALEGAAPPPSERPPPPPYSVPKAPEAAAPAQKKTWGVLARPVHINDEVEACEGTVTLVLSNLPPKCNRDNLIETIHELGFCGEVDFVYMPVDLKSKRGMGNATLNFRTREASERFGKLLHDASAKSIFPSLGGSKKLQIAPARVQGRKANTQKLEHSGLLMTFLSELPMWQPVLLDEQGQAKAFVASGDPEEASAHGGQDAE